MNSFKLYFCNDLEYQAGSAFIIAASDEEALELLVSSMIENGLDPVDNDTGAPLTAENLKNFELRQLCLLAGQIA